MKAELFLTLPLAATIVNLLFFLSLKPTRAQEPVLHQHDLLRDALVDGTCQDGICDASKLYEYFDRLQPDAHDFHEEDPMLRTIPGTDFKAYVRADIATFYRQPEGSMKEQTPAYTGQAGKFINMSPEPVSLSWVGSEGSFMLTDDQIGPWQSGGTSTFPGHVFVFTKRGTNDVLARFRVVRGTSVYFYDPFSESKQYNPARGLPDTTTELRHLSELSAEDREHYKAHRYNLDFAKLYKNFTGGQEWLTMYPKNPPTHKIWRADYFGQEHTVITEESQFVDAPPAQYLQPLSLDDLRRNESESVPFPEYRKPGLMEIKIKAASCGPRIFQIEGFLSDFEADHLRDLIHSMNLERSTTGGHLSSTRTSRTTWLKRTTDPIVDAIYRRISDALRIDEALLRQREPGERPTVPFLQQINEELQVVHYDKGQQYTAHHDFGYPKETSNSRSINFCMYLNDVEEGGQTSFPRYRNAESTGGLDVTPKKGNAVIFYMVNPDGNMDDLTQHAALPVIKGEKYFTNLWIWDPFKANHL